MQVFNRPTLARIVVARPKTIKHISAIGNNLQQGVHTHKRHFRVAEDRFSGGPSLRINWLNQKDHLQSVSI